jgi:hypothetical protein
LECVFCLCTGFEFKCRREGDTLLWHEKAAMELHNKIKPYIKEMENKDNAQETYGKLLPFPGSREDQGNGDQ